MLKRETGVDAYERKFKGAHCYFPHLAKWLPVKGMTTIAYGDHIALLCADKGINVAIDEDPDYVRKPTGYYAHGTELLFLQRKMAKLWLIGISFNNTHILRIMKDGNFSESVAQHANSDFLTNAKRLSAGDKSAGCTVISDLVLLSKKHLFFGTDIIATKKNGKLVALTTLPQSIVKDVEKVGEVFA